MARPTIDKVRIQNYGCIQDAEIQLTPLHALIGPNDSGKSTVLRALQTLATLAMAPRQGASQNDRDTEIRTQLFNGLNNGKKSRPVILTASHAGLWWSVFGNEANGSVRESTTTFEERSALYALEDSYLLRKPALTPLQEALAGATVLRADPDEMRKPSGLIRDGAPLQFSTERGEGLPGVYDAILVRDLPAYIAINDQVKKLFPTVKSISARNPTMGTKSIGVQLLDGTFVPAEQMSEGLLYFLAFAALRYLSPTALLLIEEPENGLHPARIKEVVTILREVSKTTQIVLATHSPLVINELQGHEVTVLTRTTNEGTRARLLKDTFNYEERSKVYQNGELWLSYGNGEDEHDLFQPLSAAQ